LLRGGTLSRSFSELGPVTVTLPRHRTTGRAGEEDGLPATVGDGGDEGDGGGGLCGAAATGGVVLGTGSGLRPDALPTATASPMVRMIPPITAAIRTRRVDRSAPSSGMVTKET
jgi:hypothetical protein